MSKKNKKRCGKKKEKILEAGVEKPEDVVEDGDEKEDDVEDQPMSSSSTRPNTTVKKPSPELQKMLDDMMKDHVPHELVYPPPPPKDAAVYPIGGFERCYCHKDCQHMLMEPAYLVIMPGTENEYDVTTHVKADNWKTRRALRFNNQTQTQTQK